MKRKPQGEASDLEAKIRQDSTVYKSMEVAHAVCEGIPEQLEECANRHHNIIDEPEFFIVMQLGKDNVLQTVIRRKFFAWAFLPSPRPEQTVWVYKKATGVIEMVWCLPDAETMAYLSTLKFVDKAYARMKRWVDYFYNGDFPARIRHEYDRRDWLTEREYLDAHSAELSKSLPDNGHTLGSDAPDSVDGNVDKVPDAINAIIQQKRLDARRQTQHA